MIDYNQLIEQSPCYTRLLSDINAGAVSHAYMLCGEDIIASEGAAALFAGKLARKSDIIYVPFGDSEKVKTEDINNVVSDCLLKPYDGEHKVYIIKNAHTMTDQAQNKLLKTLEEPPKHVIFVLCAANPAGLLNTIHSRCRKIAVPPFPPDMLYRHFMQNGVRAQEAETASVYGGGSITAAERIMSDSRYNSALGLIFDMYINMKRSTDILPFAADLGRYKDIAQDALDFMLIAARDIAAAASNKTELVFTKGRIDDIMSLTACFSAAACSAIIEKIGWAKRRLYYNCNYQGVIDELLFSIAEIRNLY